MSQSDAQAVRRVLSGDTDSFRVLVSGHQKGLYGMALATTGCAEEAEDLVQTCFVDAFERLGELRDHSRFRSWLYAIGHHKCLDWLRGRSSRAASVGDPSELQELVAPELPTHADPLNASALAVAAGHALMGLPIEYRTPMLLRHIAGLNHEEIGEALGMRTSTVRSRCHRARKMLRERTVELLGAEARDHLDALQES